MILGDFQFLGDRATSSSQLEMENLPHSWNDHNPTHWSSYISSSFYSSSTRNQLFVFHLHHNTNFITIRNQFSHIIITSSSSSFQLSPVQAQSICEEVFPHHMNFGLQLLKRYTWKVKKPHHQRVWHTQMGGLVLKPTHIYIIYSTNNILYI